MGLLDQVMGALGGKGGNVSGLFGQVEGLLGAVGGLDGVMSKLQAAGLDDKLQSWIGTGQNAAISPDEVKKALGPDELAQVAQKAGVSQDEAASGIADALPQLVDKLTPDGKLPDTGGLDDALGKLLGK
jgi:uncharacterized protein YidB (DUF937 family)